MKELVVSKKNEENEIQIKNEYRRVPNSFLDNYVECRIGKDNDKYNIDDIIHFPGKCYDHKISLYIHHITNTGLSITVLFKEEEVGGEVIFYNTNKEYNGLTTRKFNLFNQ